MGITVVVPPASEPVGLDEARAQCRVTTDTEDGLIAGYILAARKFAEGFTRRRFVTQTLDCTFGSNGDWWSWPRVVGERGYLRSRIDLPVSPVQSVTSVTYIDQSGNAQVLPTDQYVTRLDSPIPFIDPAYQVTWPTVRRQSASITVRVVAGWDASSFPEDLRLTLLMITSVYYDNRGVIPADMQSALESMLLDYRVTRILS